MLDSLVILIILLKFKNSSPPETKKKLALFTILFKNTSFLNDFASEKDATSQNRLINATMNVMLFVLIIVQCNKKDGIYFEKETSKI